LIESCNGLKGDCIEIDRTEENGFVFTVPPEYSTAIMKNDASRMSQRQSVHFLGSTSFLNYYNEERLHSSLNDATPDDAYHQSRLNERAA
jgi:transposase InsO family protein